MEKQAQRAVRKVGRPLSFDRDAALEKAMLLFWKHGFEATSLSELTAAMGVTPPSIYAAFGDKKQLFVAAVHRYVSGPRAAIPIIDEAKTARDAAHALLHGSVIAFTGRRTPRGCLLASSVVSSSADAEDMRREVARVRGEIEKHLLKKISVDIANGLLPRGTNADGLAAHTMAVIQGMSTLARDGASRGRLLGVASVALDAWPPN